MTILVRKTEYTTDRGALLRALLQSLCVTAQTVADVRIVRKYIGEGKNGICWLCDVAVTLTDGKTPSRFFGKRYEKYAAVNEYRPMKCPEGLRPVIVGSGPAGLFCALVLALGGAKPLVLERGDCIEERVKKVNSFTGGGELDPESNIQFGEGGAGSFSDGKLKYGSHDMRRDFILRMFIDGGAPAEIMLLEKPHVGTDVLRGCVRSLREKIISLGGEFVFRARVTKLCGGKDVSGVVYEKNGIVYTEAADAVVLAVGHSARDMFEYLRDEGYRLSPKGFGIGARIEHPQEYIDSIVHKTAERPDGIPPADYHLVTHLPDGRSVYSFCMCPGGYVVAAASEAGGVVTNGMSMSARDGKNANSAMLVSVSPADFGSDDPLAGVYFQRQLEQRAYKAGGGSFAAPVQRLGDLIGGAPVHSFGSVLPTYPRGTSFAAAGDYLPGYAVSALRAALSDMDAWLPGFYLPDALLTGAETRTTSPLRIEREESFEAVGRHGIYPCGEGAGYAGGIMSAACDGILAAEHIAENIMRRI